MNPEKTSQPEFRCPRCGTDLPANLPPERCPKCLLEAGFQGTPGIEATAMAATSPAAVTRDLPQPGEHLGHFAIQRLLGTGGMGAVFEAQDLENGRHVALKVLSHSLDAPEARSRFLREGRLAALLNHPNSVYVFGTEEIDGTPVISMELVTGGTLYDLVKANGPMSPVQAVDAILQIIAGLEAAQKLGILHRDVKPSNCFVAPDGTVKIGDFGLSISTSVRIEPALTAHGAFLGTPAFSSPEQLRGEELSARSDIYSVGATLYFLLTGQTPFEAKNVVQLLATVLEQRPKSPAQLRPAIPKGLARLVLRCLEKDPGQRFRDYQELRRALAPYTSVAPTPATLGLRVLAGLVDLLVLSTIGNLVIVAAFGSPMRIIELSTTYSTGTLLFILTAYVSSILYFAIPEGLWGTTPGKALVRLRVTRADRTLPGWGRALGRSAMFMLIPSSPYWIMFALSRDRLFDYGSPQAMAAGILFYILLAALFVTARQRNGFAALHDLATGTRVTSRAALICRPTLVQEPVPPAVVETQPRLGPYHVLEVLEEGATATWLLGYDLRLLRKVWLRKVPDATPPMPLELRSLGRIGRLRWLNGKRSPGENWDAFEALSGAPLVRLIRHPQLWKQVRFWIDDLARELEAAENDGTIPDTLGIERVWITAEGRAKILDLPGPGMNQDSTEPPSSVPQANSRMFLARVGATSLAGSTAISTAPPERPLPLGARRLLESLPHLPSLSALRAELKPLLHRFPEVTRARRVAVLGGCLLFPLLALFGSLFGIWMMQHMSQVQPGVLELNTLLQQRISMRRWMPKPGRPDEDLMGVYIATHYRSVITNAAAWQSPFAKALIQGESRKFAEESVTRYADAPPEKVAAAEAAMNGFTFNAFDLARHPWIPVMVFTSTLMFYVAFPAILAALLFRGGLVLLSAGIAFVNHRGERASRLRLFWRAILTWSPLVLGIVLFSLWQGSAGVLAAAAFAWLIVGILAILSLALPERGLQDRLAGTWPVPR